MPLDPDAMARARMEEHAYSGKKGNGGPQTYAFNDRNPCSSGAGGGCYGSSAAYGGGGYGSGGYGSGGGEE